MAQFRPVQPSTANYRPVQPSAAQYSQVQPSTTLQYGRGGRSDHEQPLYTISTTISTTITAVTQAPNGFISFEAKYSIGYRVYGIGMGLYLLRLSIV